MPYLSSFSIFKVIMNLILNLIQTICTSLRFNMRFLSLLVLFWFGQTESALAQFTPYFTNYDLSEYGAGNQNWDVSKSDDGRLYVANNEGLLEFDGIKWRLFSIPNKTTIRSVLAYENKVYIGSYEEFGFWENDGLGSMTYTSLSDKVVDGEFSDEEFWQIVPFGNKIIFRSFRNIYVYEENKITRFEDWVAMDLRYIDNWSLWLDFQILLKTIPAVLFGKGAK